MSSLVKLLMFTLVAAMLCGILTACGGGVGSIETPPSAGDSEKETSSDTDADKPEVFRGKMDSISISETLIAGVTADGKAYVDGKNNYSKKLSVSNWENIVKVSAGMNHVLGLKADGTVVASGIFHGSTWTDVVDIHAGNSLSYGLRSDGTMYVDGVGAIDIAKWENVVELEGVGDHVYGLTKDGKVYISNNATPVSDNVKAIRVTVYFALFLKNDGTVEISNPKECRKLKAAAEWTDVSDIAMYYVNHAAALKNDGTVVAVGDNDHGQCNVSEWTDIVSIAAGSNHTIGLKKDGTVVAVGNNGYGQCEVSEWTDIVAIFADKLVTVGLKADGTVVVAGRLTEDIKGVNKWENMLLK